MFASEVKRSNLSQAVDETLARCKDELHRARSSNDDWLQWDIAVQAMMLIQGELQSGEGRPRGQRSGAFTRFAIDEGERLVTMPAAMCELIEQIEFVYDKM